MRIVAGTFRGRRLAAPRGRDVRPTSDRVREAVFNLLGDIAGCSVLDLFAGTGAMGLEALSRGAVRATFVEIDRRALDVVRRNIDATITDDEHAVSLVKGDATRIARSLALTDERFDLVFFDPPYERTEDMVHDLAEPLRELVHDRSRTVVELAARHEPLVGVAAEQWGMEAQVVRRYGDTAVAVLARTDS